MGLANSLALKMAGISHDTQDADGGAIMRNSHGGDFNIYFSFVQLIATKKINSSTLD